MKQLKLGTLTISFTFALEFTVAAFAFYSLSSCPRFNVGLFKIRIHPHQFMDILAHAAMFSIYPSPYKTIIPLK